MKRNRKRFKSPIQVTVFEGSKMVFDKIFDEFPIVIGRSPRCDISFPQYDFISKQHAAIVESDDENVIVDLDSSNGLYFQGKKSKKAPVTEDSTITIGPILLRFRIHAAEQTSAELAPTQHLNIDNEKTTEIKRSAIHDSEKTIPVKKHEPTHVQSFIKPKPQMPAQARSSQAHKQVHLHKEPKQAKHQSSHHNHHDHKAMIDGFELIKPHPMAANLRPSQRVLEGFVTWKNDVYDLQQFYPGEKVTAGRGFGIGLSVPTLSRRSDLAFYDGTQTKCLIPQGANFAVHNQEREISMDELARSNALSRHASGGYVLRLGNEDLLSFDLAHDVKVHFRYAPMPRQLTRVKMVEPDEEIKKTTLVSGFIHIFIMVLAIVNAPPSKGPKLENVPDRYARLLVEPPRKLIETPPKPTPEPKKPEPEKIVKKEKLKPQKVVQKKIVQQRPRKVVLNNTNVKQISKAPPSNNPAPKNAGAPVNVNNMGPLAALTALAPSNVNAKGPVSININPNAGGPSKFTTTGVLGTLKSSSGRLQAGGVASVQTKGLGVGSGTGYGIQGIKGTAGSRGVAGAVVGSPQLLSVGVSEGLTRAQVMAVVKKHQGEIQQCYERSLFQTPGLGGKVEYEWEISPGGGVNWAKVKSTQMQGGDAMNSCVLSIFKRMKFPQAKNGMTTVPSLPLDFGKM